MKAGGVGSSPNGATSKSIQSQPLHAFLNDVGEAVFSLNTIVVGLDAVETGHQKPASLDISWNPDDRVAAARKSRKFALEAVLVRAAEALQQYILAVTRLPRFQDLRSKWDGDTSAAEKFRQTAKRLSPNDHLVSGATLLIHWRNRVVHAGSRARLSASDKTLLQESEAAIAEKYKGLNVDRLLAHFEEGRPTLKDVSSLIAISINLIRKLDSAVYHEFGKDDLDSWLDYYGLLDQIEKVKSDTKKEKIDASLRRLISSKAPMLLEPYSRYYLAATCN
jgi:hypothetical protein